MAINGSNGAPGFSRAITTLTAAQRLTFTGYKTSSLIRDTTTGDLLYVISSSDGTFANTVFEPVGSSEGPYVDGTGANFQLERFKRYITSGNTVAMPLNPTLGDWVSIWNNCKVVDFGIPDCRTTITTVDPIEDPIDRIQVFPGGTVPPGVQYTLVFTGTDWELFSDITLAATLTNVNDGQVLRGGVEYTVVTFGAPLTFKLPPVPAGITKIRLGAGSTHPVIIEQYDPAAPVHQLRLEGNTVTNSFTVGLSNIGEQVGIEGNPGADRWIVYRPWVLRDFLSPILDWQPDTVYTGATPTTAGDQVIAARNADGIDFIFERLTDGTSGPEPPGFDPVEEAQWQPLGAAPVNLPILQLMTVTIRGYASSFTVASNMVPIDRFGADYNPADWAIVSDSLGGIAPGTALNATGYAPPTNGTRTLTLQYQGGTTERGLSGIRISLRAGVSSTGISAIATSYFSGNGDLRVYSSGESAQSNTFTYTLAAPFDFLTSPTITSDNTLVGLQDTLITAPADLSGIRRDAANSNWIQTPGPIGVYRGVVADFTAAKALGNLRQGEFVWIESLTPEGRPGFRTVVFDTLSSPAFNPAVSALAWSGDWGVRVDAATMDSTTTTMDSTSITMDRTA